MKNMVVSNFGFEKKPGSERSWVRKGLGPKRLISLGPTGLGADIRLSSVARPSSVRPLSVVH